MVTQSDEFFSVDDENDSTNLKRKRTDLSPLDVLHRLCVSTSREEFSPPSNSSTTPFKRHHRSCPICQRSIHRQGRTSFQCDFCPLIYHLDCLKCSKPSSNELWTCPNHHSTLIDRISRKTSCERVQIRQHSTKLDEPIRIRQDFPRPNSTIEISQIPSFIENSYSNRRCVEQILDEILQDVSNEKFYSFETLPNEINRKSSSTFFIDLRQFRSSHAALIHLPSERVIYLRKRVVWFGSSPSIDIDLHRFSSLTSTNRCQAISERHACLIYDNKQNRFELLNYSEFGTIVDGLRYGFDENLLESTCFCRENQRNSSNTGANVDQGTRIQIGCHRFVFYRYIQR